jgi:O-antigen biosynthesis protein WbqV
MSRELLVRAVGGRRFRYLGLVLIDTVAALATLGLALALRMNGVVPEAMLRGLIESLPVVALVSLATFHSIGLYRRTWRYVSMTDLPLLVVAASLAIIGSVTVLAVLGMARWLPTSVPVIQWFILVAALAGTRVARRLGGEYRRGYVASVVAAREEPRLRAIVIGTGDSLDLALRRIAVDPERRFEPVGILDDVAGHLRLRVRGVRVLGETSALEHAVRTLDAENLRPQCVIFADPAERAPGATLMRLVTDAESLGLTVANLPGDRGHAATAAADETAPLDMASLLGRPPAELDMASVARLVAHQRVMVTGAGGTIGRELVHQIAAASPGEIILVDACEFNLYSVDQELAESFPDVPRVPLMCSIRQRGAVMAAFAKYRPNLVFHAAALKHVPLVEANPCAGVQTNVLGTRNVADAARRFGVRAMVQVSTDKAVNPVGVMGATKRLGELYCQALDLDGVDCPVAPRFLTVRFGNVLGSSGSLIPLFQRQLSRRVPLTVTHPEIRRYFMTVHEAVHLILRSAAHALEADIDRGRIFVLDMGEQIPIIDVARRMIRLAGLEPDRDVKIEITGLRPGEKLYEELFDVTERKLGCTLPGILEAEPVAMRLDDLNREFDRLNQAAGAEDTIATRALLAEILRPATRTSVGYGALHWTPAADAWRETREPVEAVAA